MVRGSSNNLMKATARRRRGKAEIKEQQRTEDRKQKEIVKKLAQIEEMEQKMKEMKKKADQVAPLEQNFQQLIDAGLIRMDAHGNVTGVNSWDEHQ